jgi:hypothetical protein
MSTRSYFPLNLAGVPTALLEQPWIGWREVLDPDGKLRKTPFQIGFPMDLASNSEEKEAARAEIGTPQREPVRCNANPEVKHWRCVGDVAEVLALAPELFDGFGIVLRHIAGITFIDLDHVRDPETGVIESWAERMIATFDSWTEVSVSGTGIHIFCLGRLPGPGLVNYLDGDPAMKIEAYSTGRFAYLTGHVLHAAPVAERQRLITLLAAHVRPAGTPTASAARTMQNGETPILAGARNDALFRIARGFVLKGLRGEALATALLAVSHRRCVPVPPDADVVAIARHADRLPDRRPA